MIFGILTGMALVVVLIWAYRERTLPETIVTLCLAGGIVSCHQSDWYQKEQRESAAQEAVEARAAATPHVIREADGCKVYTFKAEGSYHYFTRCESGTITERNWREGCGKNKTCDRKEVIPTENVK